MKSDIMFIYSKVVIRRLILYHPLKLYRISAVKIRVITMISNRNNVKRE